MKIRRIPIHPPLFSVVVPLIIGITAGNVHGFFPGSLFIALFLPLYFLFTCPALKTNRIVFVWLGSLACIYGFYSMFRMEHSTLPPLHISRFCDGSVYRIKGRILSFQHHYPEKIRLKFEVQGLSGNQGPELYQKVKGSIFLNIYNHENFGAGYGDRLFFKARLKPVRNFSNPGGFDYQTYLKRRGITGSSYINADQIRVVPCRVWPFNSIQAMENLRNRFFRFIRDVLGPSDRADILCALITGKKKMIRTQVRDDFSRAGTSHLLAISGLHMSILGFVFYWIWFYLLSLSRSLLISGRAKKTAMVLTLALLFLYAFFSGFSPSIQRAFIMTLIFMLSFMMEKEAQLLNTLALAAILILILDPPALFSISFQLSFAGVLFILVGFDLVRQRGWLEKNGLKIKLLSAGLVPLMAGLGTAPLVAHYFNMVSHVQVPANLVLVPILGGLCLPLGFAALFLFFIHAGASAMIIQLCGRLIDLGLGVTDFLISLPFSWSRTVTPDRSELLSIYLFLGTLFWLVMSRKKRGPMLFLIFLSLAAGINTGLKIKKRLDPGQLMITILDVGQGSAGLIQTPEGHTILVDGSGFSGLSSFDPGRYIVGPFLWHKKILTLDMVVLTHPQSDHMNGLGFILNNFKVRKLLKNKDSRKSRVYEKMMATCRKKKIPLILPDCVQNQFFLDQVKINFFHCSSLVPGDNFNNNSLVFQVHFQNLSMLFPGDVMHGREIRLAESAGPALKSSILLAPHHGSSSSSHDFFLDQVKPESVIVSCGFKNRYGFPHGEVLEKYRERGYNVYRTDLNGAVTITSNGRQYEISTHIKDGPCFSSTFHMF